MADPYLRDIYQYFTNRTGTQDPMNTPNTSEMSDADFYANLTRNQGDGLEYQGTGDRGANFGIRQGGMLDRMNQQHPGAAYIDPVTRQMRWDFDKLPRTRFGTVENSIRVDPQMRNKLIDPRAVYNDSAYGDITSRGNYNSGNQWMGQLLMMLAGAGMGSVAGGASGLRTAMGGLRGMQGAMNGNPFSLAMAFLPALGVHPLARTFLAQAMQQARMRGKR